MPNAPITPVETEIEAATAAELAPAVATPDEGQPLTGPLHITPAEALEVARRADEEVSRLCDGGRWTMRVPVDEERDSDMLMASATNALRSLAAQVERLTTARDVCLDAMGRASDTLRGGPTANDARKSPGARLHDAANILDGAISDVAGTMSDQPITPETELEAATAAELAPVVVTPDEGQPLTGPLHITVLVSHELWNDMTSQLTRFRALAERAKAASDVDEYWTITCDLAEEAGR